MCTESETVIDDCGGENKPHRETIKDEDVNLGQRYALE
jgi:hypothetical protein